MEGAYCGWVGPKNRFLFGVEIAQNGGFELDAGYGVAEDQGGRGKRVPGSGCVLLGESMVQGGVLERTVLGMES